MTKAAMVPHTALPISADDTLAAWNCDEVTAVNNLADSAGAYTLTQHNFPTVSPPLFGVNRASNGSRTLDGATQYFSGTADTAARDVFRSGDYTVVALWKTFNAAAGSWFNIDGTVGSGLATENFLCHLNIASGGEVRILWEKGTASVVSSTTTGASIQTGRIYFSVVTVYRTKAGTAGNVDLRFDLWDTADHSLFSQTFTNLGPAENGSNADFGVGGHHDGVSSLFDGVVDSVHVLKFGDPDGHYSRWAYAHLHGADYDEDVLYQKGNYVETWRVKIEDGDGVERDVTNLKGHNFLVGGQIDESITSKTKTATINLRREHGKYSLAPFMEGSLFNLNGAGAFDSHIHLRRRVLIEVAVTPPNRAPQEFDYRLHFDGFIRHVSWPKEVMRIDCHDKMQELERTFINTERSYAGATISSIDDSGASNKIIIQTDGAHRMSVGDSFTVEKTENYNGAKTVDTVDSSTQVTCVETGTGSLAAEEAGHVQFPTPIATVMQNIIDDNNPANEAVAPGVYKGGVPSIWEPTTLNWNIRFFTQGRVPLSEALSALPEQLGALMAFEFDSFRQSFRLKIYEPARTVTWSSGMLSFDESQIIGKLNAIDFDIRDIRNVCEVDYFDLDGVQDSDGYFPRSTYTGKDTASVAKYGRTWCGIKNAWNIDSLPEATRLGDNVVSDLGEPIAHLGAHVPFRRIVALNDLYRFAVPTSHSTSNLDLSPTEITTAFKTGSRSTTTMGLRGQPSGNPSAHLRRITFPGLNSDRPTKAPVAPDGLALVEDVGALVVSWAAPTNKGMGNVDWSEVHVKAGVAAFTPDSTTLKKVVRGTKARIEGLTPGSDYAVHVLHRDRFRNLSNRSAAQTGQPLWTILNQPSFRAYRSGTQVMSTGGSERVDLSVEVYDLNSDADFTALSGSLHKFVAPVKGIYHFESQIKVIGTSVDVATLTLYSSTGIRHSSEDFQSSTTFVYRMSLSADILIDPAVDGDVELHINWSTAKTSSMTVQSGTGNFLSGSLVTQAS